MDEKRTIETESNHLEIDTPLTTDEAHLLEDCEKEIAAGPHVFYRVGVALTTIRHRRP
jgi:hypothetical protein